MERMGTSLTLPCGAVLGNRLAKAAMTEGLAEADGLANQRHVTLYRRWGEGGAGLLITGNVMIDRHHLERPGNVVLDGPQSPEARARLKAWTEAGAAGGAHLWMQLSHSGRQTPKKINRRPSAPSAVRLRLPGGQFALPCALTDQEIRRLIERFASAAAIARDCGFTGVQIHGAHGYLISEFLSPLANRREDEWGGSLENRARFLLAVVAAVRSAVGPDFPVSVKLNSADFQKGGFTLEEAVQVARRLEAAGVDLLEISGGTYEQPRMMGMDGIEPAAMPMRESTRRREAYFLTYAPAIREAVTLPLMVTGGFRTRDGMERAVGEDGIAVIGLARPLCVRTDAPAGLLSGRCAALDRWEDKLSWGKGIFGPSSPVRLIKALNGMAAMAWFYAQLVRLGDGLEPDPGLSVGKAFFALQAREARLVKDMRQRG